MSASLDEVPTVVRLSLAELTRYLLRLGTPGLGGRSRGRGACPSPWSSFAAGLIGVAVAGLR